MSRYKFSRRLWAQSPGKKLGLGEVAHWLEAPCTMLHVKSLAQFQVSWLGLLGPRFCLESLDADLRLPAA